MCSCSYCQNKGIGIDGCVKNILTSVVDPFYWTKGSLYWKKILQIINSDAPSVKKKKKKGYLKKLFTESFENPKWFFCGISVKTHFWKLCF